MILDKVYDTWKNIEQLSKEDGGDPAQFLRKQLLFKGNISGIEIIRTMIGKDYEETPESIQKLQELMTALERTSDRLLKGVPVTDVDSYVWGEVEEVNVFDLDEFQAIVSTKEAVGSSALMKTVTMQKDTIGRLHPIVVPAKESKKILRINKTSELEPFLALAWKGDKVSQAIFNDLAEHTLRLPLVVISRPEYRLQNGNVYVAGSKFKAPEFNHYNCTLCCAGQPDLKLDVEYGKTVCNGVDVILIGDK